MSVAAGRLSRIGCHLFGWGAERVGEFQRVRAGPAASLLATALAVDGPPAAQAAVLTTVAALPGRPVEHVFERVRHRSLLRALSGPWYPHPCVATLQNNRLHAVFLQRLHDLIDGLGRCFLIRVHSDVVLQSVSMAEFSAPACQSEWPSLNPTIGSRRFSAFHFCDGAKDTDQE